MNTSFIDTLDKAIEEDFNLWWGSSFPNAPANKQARDNYVAFGKHLLELHKTRMVTEARDELISSMQKDKA